MTSFAKTPTSEAFLRQPKDWSLWDTKFQALAIDYKLWNWVSGVEGASLLEEPQPTANQTGVTTRAADATLRDTTNDWRMFQFKVRKHEKQEESIKDLRAWVAKTVDDPYFQTCCLPAKSLKDWYASLKKQAKGNKKEMTRALQNRYRKAVTPLTKPPQDWESWIQSWKNVMHEGIREKLAEATHPAIWIRDFLEAVKPQCSGWVTQFYLSEKILTMILIYTP
ncbi:hypothetical protein HRG_013571 [Hirsutella rhossiliensis]